MPGRGNRGLSEEAMMRKNITITRQQNEFLERHPEINQSALFRQVVETLMTTEKAPRYSAVRDLRLGKTVYKSGAFVYRPKASERKSRE